MQVFAALSASALALAVGVSTASAESFNPVTGYSGSTDGYAYEYGYSAPIDQGRVGGTPSWDADPLLLEQFREGK